MASALKTERLSISRVHFGTLAGQWEAAHAQLSSSGSMSIGYRPANHVYLLLALSKLSSHIPWLLPVAKGQRRNEDDGPTVPKTAHSLPKSDLHVEGRSMRVLCLLLQSRCTLTTPVLSADPHSREIECKITLTSGHHLKISL